MAFVSWLVASVRLARANPGRRIPYLGWPPSKPPWSASLNAAELALSIAGALSVYGSSYDFAWLTCVPFVLGFVLPQLTHNRALQRKLTTADHE